MKSCHQLSYSHYGRSLRIYQSEGEGSRKRTCHIKKSLNRLTSLVRTKISNGGQKTCCETPVVLSFSSVVGPEG
jgi:hypothetical protein